MADSSPNIVWFRQDLRLTDNPALHSAARKGAPVLPVFILDESHEGDWAPGAASRWWLHKSLQSLDDALDGALVLLRGDPQKELSKLVDELGVESVFWNRLYEPQHIERDNAIKKSLQDASVRVKSFNASLLFEPPNTNKPDGTPYRVFTPFYRRGCLENGIPPREPLDRPDDLNLYAHNVGDSIEDLDLLPEANWYEEMEQEWTPGEKGADARLSEFLSTGIDGYDEGRNRPDQRNVSRLSPHLHFGEISPNQAWYAVLDGRAVADVSTNEDRFLSELGWREFSYNLLYNEPEIPTKNLQKKFDRFPWREDKAALKVWQRGNTGYPIVDAGMRELWRTGYMHNRVRMIVGSFLVKNLLLHWQHGAEWFWDTLLDADLANNSASWQWIAGCGADAAPYFRIFNPVTQGNKFDPNGDYVRKYVPELSKLPDKYLHSPWDAPKDVLDDAEIMLGETYPKPIVDLKKSRVRALDAFKSLRGS